MICKNIVITKFYHKKVLKIINKQNNLKNLNTLKVKIKLLINLNKNILVKIKINK